jgi:glutamine synthetase
VGFVERHGLWTQAQQQAVAAVEERIGQLGVVRLGFADAHGVVRGKTLVAEAARDALRGGARATTTMLLKDLGGRTVFPVFTADGTLPAMRGAADMVMVPDPLSFRVLPWAPHSGWLLCDLFFPDGTKVPLSTRDVLRRVLVGLEEGGQELLVGLEVEFHLLRLADPDAAAEPPAVLPLNAGHQYLTELRYDALDPMLEVLRATLQGLGLPLRTLEVEFGPSQVEATFAPLPAMEAADLMLLFRSATRQVCRRHGFHASFMCRPHFPGAMSSGWHLHQSLRRGGQNLFIPGADDAALSPSGRAWLGGLLAHAGGAAAFSTPTVNGYKRYRPHSMAPERAVWACDNRGAMVRVLGGAGDPATRLENRVGEPAANPYLYIASQVVSGLDGLSRGLDPGASADRPYDGDAPHLPRSLEAALDALAADDVLCRGFGDGFVEYYLHLKRSEVARFHAEVTDWEQREYFSLL